MTRRPHAPAAEERPPPDSRLVDFVRALARQAAREDHQAAKLKQTDRGDDQTRKTVG